MTSFIRTTAALGAEPVDPGIPANLAFSPSSIVLALAGMLSSRSLFLAPMVDSLLLAWEGFSLILDRCFSLRNLRDPRAHCHYPGGFISIVRPYFIAQAMSRKITIRILLCGLIRIVSVTTVLTSSAIVIDAYTCPWTGYEKGHLYQISFPASARSRLVVINQHYETLQTHGKISARVRIA